jgi:hypothetical protein
MDDRLEHLLRNADALPPDSTERDLAGRIRRRARRNDRIRSTSIAAALLIGVAIGAFTLTRPQKTAPLAIKADPLAVETELKRLNHEATHHAAIADRLMQIEVMSPQVDPTEFARNLQRVRDEAALSLIYQAEMLAPLPARRPAAVALYQKTIDLFPKTHWASLAKQRLEALQLTQENL